MTRVGDGEGDSGTLVMGALSEMMAQVPRDRIAGVVVVSDGRAHDVSQIPDIPAPFHLLQTGRDADWDRRLIVSNAPSFAILDEEFVITLRIEDQGQVPADIGTEAEVILAVDGGQPRAYVIPVGEDIDLPVTLPHGGLNVIEFRVPEADGELTGRNNAAVVQINGVRDRLRVLLVSGEPHTGQRTWRNLLKADAAVDLVHFTILRPAGQAGRRADKRTEPDRVSHTRALLGEDRRVRPDYLRTAISGAASFRRSTSTMCGPTLNRAVRFWSPQVPISRLRTASSARHWPPFFPAEPTAIVREEGFLPLVSEMGQKQSGDRRPARWVRNGRCALGAVVPAGAGGGATGRPIGDDRPRRGASFFWFWTGSRRGGWLCLGRTMSGCGIAGSREGARRRNCCVDLPTG